MAALSHIFATILNSIQERRGEKALVIGIDGIDASGKTRFTKGLADFHSNRGLANQVIHLDDFQNPKIIRYSGSDPAANYYTKSFNLEMLIERLLAPVHNKQIVSTTLLLLDLLEDTFILEREYAIDPSKIVILEGVFLFRPELIGFTDYRILIDISFEEARKRLIARDVPLVGSEVIAKIDTKYFPAQVKYREECKPAEVADLVINNSDWNDPHTVMGVAGNDKKQPGT